MFPNINQIICADLNQVVSGSINIGPQQSLISWTDIRSWFGRHNFQPSTTSANIF